MREAQQGKQAATRLSAHPLPSGQGIGLHRRPVSVLHRTMGSSSLRRAGPPQLAGRGERTRTVRTPVAGPAQHPCEVSAAQRENRRCSYMIFKFLHALTVDRPATRAAEKIARESGEPQAPGPACVPPAGPPVWFARAARPRAPGGEAMGASASVRHRGPRRGAARHTLRACRKKGARPLNPRGPRAGLMKPGSEFMQSTLPHQERGATANCRPSASNINQLLQRISTLSGHLRSSSCTGAERPPAPRPCNKPVEERPCTRDKLGVVQRFFLAFCELALPLRKR